MDFGKFSKRSCLGCLTTENLIDVFKPIQINTGRRTYCDLLEMSYYLTLFPTQNIKYICKQCAQRLVDAYKFKKMVVSSMHKLTNDNFYNNESIETIEISKFHYIRTHTRIFNEKATKIVIRPNRKSVDKKTGKNFTESVVNLDHNSVSDINDLEGSEPESEKAVKVEKEQGIDNFSNEEEYIKYCKEKREKTKRKRKYIPEVLPFKLDEHATSCPICKEEHTNSRMLKIHMNVHYSNFICDQCGKGFVNRRGLKKHVNVHEQGPFTCNECGKVFNRKNTFLGHQRMKHGPGRYYVCNLCKEKFLTIHLLLNHKKNEHGVCKMHKCPYCDKSYIVAGELTRHMKGVHLMIRDKECPQCNKKFFGSQKLKYHMLYAHNIGVRKHVCNYCQKRFAKRYNLKVHLRTHYKDMQGTAQQERPAFNVSYH